MNALLEIRDLDVALPLASDRKFAVRGANLQVARDEIVCVVGESGSGKSTLAHAVMGLLSPALKISGGSIALDGRKVSGATAAEMRALRGEAVSMIFQEPLTALNPLMPVGKQIAEAFAAHNVKLSNDEVEARVFDLLHQVGLPDVQRVAKSYPFELSGGQRQRIMIASAISLKPKLLIADEPTTALDVTTQAQVLELIVALQKEYQLGVLFITHDFGVVADIADRIVVMRQGEIVEEGTTSQILSDPQHEYTQGLIAAVPPLQPKPAVALPEAKLLRVRGVSKKYGGRRSLFSATTPTFIVSNNINMTIHEGEIYGLVGESGSGKSTLGRMIVGLADPDSGDIYCDDEAISKTAFRSSKKLRRSIQMVFQDPYSSFNPRIKIGPALIAGSIASGEDKAVAMQRARELMELVHLDPGALDRFPHEFSGGQRQRLGIARALMMQPRLLVADEPVSALDVSVQEQVIKLLLEIKTRIGLAILFITHDLRVAGQICDRIGVLRKGVLVEENTAERILTQPSHEYTKMLLDSVPGRSWR